MKFDKYWVALQLQNEGIGRKKILQKLYNERAFTSRKDVVRYEKKLKKLNIEIVASNESEYPKSLKEISDYPLVLFTKGNRDLLSKKMITVVGTREMSSYGKWVVRYILKPLKEVEDIAIISGLARGIDGEVHKACLDFNIPTVAVVAGGIDKGYPKSNQEIYDEIVKSGLVISEFPPGRKIVKGMFPMRNRILAGMSSATVIVESDIEGGSLITMNLALEYGREIFAVPNSIEKESLQGCNVCILQGATPLFLSTQLTEFLDNIYI